MNIDPVAVAQELVSDRVLAVGDFERLDAFYGLSLSWLPWLAWFRGRRAAAGLPRFFTLIVTEQRLYAFDYSRRATNQLMLGKQIAVWDRHELQIGVGTEENPEIFSFRAPEKTKLVLESPGNGERIECLARTTGTSVIHELTSRAPA